MAKEMNNWTMRNAIQIGGFVVLIATILLGAGAIKPSIEENCKEIKRVDEKGCQPSMEVRGQLNTATEYVYGESVVHGDWDGATDLALEVHFTINTDNTGGAGTDTCDGVVEFYYKGDGEDECKRQTVEGAKVIGAASQYTQFSIDIPLNWDLADNIVQVDDIIGLRFNFETDTSEVDDVTITNISLQYNTSHLGIEDGDI